MNTKLGVVGAIATTVIVAAAAAAWMTSAEWTVAADSLSNNSVPAASDALLDAEIDVELAALRDELALLSAMAQRSRAADVEDYGGLDPTEIHSSQEEI